MSISLPVVNIQCDWNDVLRVPNGSVWISSKKLNETSVDHKITSSINDTDSKIQINVPDSYHYISHSILSLVVKHISSGLKVAFIAPSKVYIVHTTAILSVSMSETALAVSSCEEDKLLLWDSRTGKTQFDLKGHGGPVYKCRFFPSGVVVLSAGADGSCRIWSAESGINPVTLKGHTMSIFDISIIEKGRNVVSVSRDGSAKLWDVGESKCLDNILEGHGPINCCAVATTTDEVEVKNEREIGTGNKVLIVGCESGWVICTHIAKREELFCVQLESPCNSCIVVDQSIIVGCSNGKIVHLNLEDGSFIKECYESASPVISLMTLPNSIFAIGRQDGTCTVMSLNEAHSSIRVQLTGSDCDGIRDITFNGKWLMTGCRDSKVRKYDFNQINVHYKSPSR